jgi:uncharacterized membrane protein YhaH (DUF805 family)
MDWKFLFFKADGRINRQSYWIGILIIIAATVILGWIPLIGQVLGLAAIWCGVCLNSKRLHDMGKSGWLQLIPIGIQLVLVTVGMGFGGLAMMANYGHDGLNPMAMGGLGMGMGMMGLAGLVNLAFLLWVGLTPGEAADNRFGAPPAAGLPTAVAPA